MKKYLYHLLLLFAITAFAQDEWPEPIVLTDSFPIYKDFTRENWQQVDTWDKEVEFKEILTPKYSGLFKSREESITSIQTVSHVWGRYRLKNISQHPVIITFSATRAKEHIYIKKGNKWVHLVSGDMIPWSERDGIKDLMQIPYTLNAGEEIKVYQNFGDVTFWSNPDPRIGNYLKIIDRNFKDRPNYTAEDVISFGFFGFMIFGVIFNLFFYYVNREKVYLVFAFMLISSAFLMAENVFSSLAFDEYRNAYPFFLVTTITFFIIMLLHTVRFFFRVNIHFPGWDKFLVYFSVYIGISGVSVYLGIVNRWVIFLIIVCFITALAAFIFFIAAIVMIIKLLRKKDKEARLFVIAAMPFIVSPVIKAILPFDWTITTCGMWTILVLSWGMFARFKSLQVANARAALEREEERNRLIAIQKEELEQLVKERTAELEHSLENLKQTQNQLVQSEKMASLGELTAGIAHEIQNPLNFVNNFSDVSIELLDEMEEELDKGDIEEAKAISGDIKQNLEKIMHHGKRADSIVKGMLQHSRASSGQKEPTDINALADEYLRLAYHGLRAKDKSFNAELVTNFDQNLPKANVIPQDVGRVLLNLFTNAFYATQEKKKNPPAGEGGETIPYKPTLTVTTSYNDNWVEITVKDNGTGIPEEIQDKILQPFFTTKPTGEGTGLGLSLSYDIIVKGHAGTIAIESKEGEGSEFIIRLPLKN